MNDVGPNSEPCFVCRTCSWVSYHPNDIINRYCGNCHQFDGWEGDDSGYRQFGEPWAEEAAMDWAEEAAKGEPGARHMTYRKKLLAGEVGRDQLDDYIDQWNNTDTSEHLHTYLGFTWPQWQEFMTCPPPYFCPTSGDVEDRQNSGIDQCCDRPELHVPQDL